jgi:Domain of unknown function (DUF4381)
MADMTQIGPLSQLRDIHLPQPISWWPLAPGWYFLLGLVLIIAVMVIIYFVRRNKKTTVGRLALQQLSFLQQQYQANTPGHIIAMELSKLLRQVALAHYPRQKVAHLRGEAWITFLDETSPKTNFKSHGQILITAPYQKYVDIDLMPVFPLCTDWIISQKRHV